MAVMKNFSPEEEEQLKAYIFTNPGGRTSFIYPDQVLIVGEELPPLISAYSRTHLPLETRILQFLDQVKPEQTRRVLPQITRLMDILRLPDGTLRVSRKTQSFHKEYVLDHGHSSIKEEANLHGYCEETSDFVSDEICGDPLARPQKKSTRYIKWDKVNNPEDLKFDPDIWSHSKATEVRLYLEEMSRNYISTTLKLGGEVLNDRYASDTIAYMLRRENLDKAAKRMADKKKKIEGIELSEEEIAKERDKIERNLKDPESARKEATSFVLDYSRVYLTAANRTSTGFSADIRTVERIITRMISSPSLESRQRGMELQQEAEKIAPVLLGEKGHIKMDNAWIETNKRMQYLANKLLGNRKIKNYLRPQVNLIGPPDINIASDKFNATCAIFPYTNLPFEAIYNTMEDKDVVLILDTACGSDKRNPIHPNIHHNGLSVQPVMGHHAYRDIFRHRNGARSNQLLTTRLGFEVPEIFQVYGMQDEYLSHMKKASDLFESIYPENPVAAQKLIPFGSLTRALHTWNVKQMQYVAHLRADIKNGNRSYVMMAREMMNGAARIMPLTAKHFSYDKKEYPPELWKIGYEWYDAEGR